MGTQWDTNVELVMHWLTINCESDLLRVLWHSEEVNCKRYSKHCALPKINRSRFKWNLVVNISFIISRFAFYVSLAKLPLKAKICFVRCNSFLQTLFISFPFKGVLLLNFKRLQIDCLKRHKYKTYFIIIEFLIFLLYWNVFANIFIQ